MIALIILPTLLASSPVAPVKRHALFLVDTSGSAYKATYLGNPYINFISRTLYQYPVKSTSTCICYDASAGFYPPSRMMYKIDDVRGVVQSQIYKMRDYWKKRCKTPTEESDLESDARGGTRLDRALEKALDDQASWPSDVSVSIYFLTDGGVDFRKNNVKISNKEIQESLSFISSAMKQLCFDPRVQEVQVFGLLEQPDIVRPSAIFGRRSISQQWVYYWLKGAKGLRVMDFREFK